MKSHKERVEKIKETIDNNKVFSVLVVILLFIILGSAVMNKISDYKEHKESNTSISEEQTVADTNINEAQGNIDTNINEEVTAVDTSINEENNSTNEKAHWRFYWIDLWILLGGGGFCLIKILQEKKKAREKL